MRPSAVLFTFASALCLAATGLNAQTDSPAQPGQIELRVELRQAGRWQPVDVHTVFRNKEELRFTFKSSFPGYLKVLNHSSDGQTSAIYPLADAPKIERLEANTSYLIPGPKGSFVVAGKPGFDLTEWFVSSSPVDAAWQPAAASPSQPSTLLPRCDHDELQPLRACTDSRAGPAPLSRPLADKSDSSLDASMASRDLNFRSRALSTLITVPDSSKKLVVYEFRVAHH